MFEQSSTAHLSELDQPKPQFPHFYLLIFVAAELISLILGGYAINRTGFWYDETASIGFITDSATWQHNYPEQMPVYYGLLRGWTDVTGTSEVAGRWLSLLLGLLTLAVTYRLAERYMGRQVAICAVLLLGSSAFFVRYFREMRPYMLLALACTLSMWFFLNWLRYRKWLSAVLYVIISISALYTHYFGGLVIAVEGLYFLITSGLALIKPKFRSHLQFFSSRFTWMTFGLFVLIALALIPYLPSYLSGLKFGAGSYATIALTPAQALDSTAFTLTNDSLAIALLLVALAIFSRAKGKGLALLWAFFPVVTVLLVHTFAIRIFTNPRYIIFIWPAFAMLMAIGLLALNRRAAMTAVTVLVIVGIGQVYTDLPHTVPGTLNNPPWREMFTIVGQRSQPKSLVFVDMINPVGFHNYQLPMAYYFSKFMPAGTAVPIELDYPPAPDNAYLQMRAKDGSEIWWIATDGEIDQHGKDALYALYQTGYARCYSMSYPDYNSSLAYWGHVTTDAFEFENGFRIDHQPLNKMPVTYAPAQVLNVDFGAYTIKTMPIDYSISLQVVDGSGKLMAQSDSAPANSRTSGWNVLDKYCDNRSLTLPAQPGIYQVRFILYDAISGTRVKLKDGSTDIINWFTISVS